MQLTKFEMEIMEVLWATEKPMSRADLLKSPHTWKDSSIHIMLNGLLKKGAIREAGVVKCVKTYGRTFAHTMTREQYWAQLACSGNTDPAKLIAEILFYSKVDYEMIPATLATARDEYERRHGF